MEEAERVLELSHRLDAAGLPWPRSLAEFDGWLQAGEGDIGAAVQRCRLRVRRAGRVCELEPRIAGSSQGQPDAPVEPACSRCHQPTPQSRVALPCHSPAYHPSPTRPYPQEDRELQLQQVRARWPRCREAACSCRACRR